MLEQHFSYTFWQPLRKKWSIQRFGPNYLLSLLVIDTLLIQLMLWASMELRFVLPIGRTLSPLFSQRLPLPALHLAVEILWIASFFVCGVYASTYIIRWHEEFQRILSAHTVASLCLAGLLYLANVELMRLVYFYFYLLTLAALLGYRTLLRLWHRWQRDPVAERNVLVIGATERLKDLIPQFQRDAWPAYHLVGLVCDGPPDRQFNSVRTPILGTLEQVNLAEIMQRHEVHDVVLALPRDLHGQMLNLLETLRNLPINLRVIPDYFDLTFRNATIGRLGHIPVIDLHDSPIDSFQRLLKRLVDLVVATGLLCVVWPIMVAIVLAIKIEDGGPILYFAQRVGEKGKLFTMYKFRSMVINADQLQNQVNRRDEQGNIIHKHAADPRVTRIGRLLRRTSLDELPQLINVLKGEMSLVGPRPELPWLVEQYAQWQYQRLSVPQGITGWWQVNGRSNNLMHLNTEQDIYYIRNYSIWLDLQILWRTVSIVLRGKGAY